MFKFTSKGLVEFGEVIELTDDDRLELSNDIGIKTALPTIAKKNGRWIQQSSTDMLDTGYRIYEEPEDEDEEEHITEMLEMAKTWKQVLDTPCFV